jgi:hypothetical protein
VRAFSLPFKEEHDSQVSDSATEGEGKESRSIPILLPPLLVATGLDPDPNPSHCRFNGGPSPHWEEKAEMYFDLRQAQEKMEQEQQECVQCANAKAETKAAR